MMSTVGLELTNFLNPDLTWKTVSKGSRSTTRRTRKPLARNLTAGEALGDKSPQRAENATVLESEKLGVAVLGHRFSEKIEHVPIKKRKFNLRSPSPPPRTPSPCIEAVQNASSLGYSRNSNGKRVLRATDASMEATTSPGIKGKISEEMTEKLDDREDFSGIEILAAAACDNFFDSEQAEETKAVEESLHEEDDSRIIEETGATMETTNLLPKDVVLEDKREESAFQDATTSSAQRSLNDRDNKIVDMSVPSLDDRLHWDLNVVIDAWDQPSQFENVGSQTNTAEVTSVVGSGKHVVEGCEMEKETKDVRHYELVAVDPSEAPRETNIISDSRDVLHGSNRMDSELESCSGLDCSHDECSAGAKASTQAASIDVCLSDVPCPNDMANNTALPDYLVEKTEGCSSVVQEEETFCVENVEVEKCDVTSPFVPALDRFTCEVDSLTLEEEAEDSAGASSYAPQVMFSADNSQVKAPISLGMEPVSKEEVDVKHPLPCDEGATSRAAVEEIHIVVTRDATGLADEALQDNNAVEINSSMDFGSKELMLKPTDATEIGCTSSSHENCRVNTPTSSSSKVKIEGASDDISVSDTSHDKVHVVAIGNSGELHDGYDSQFEDGELRESDVHLWEDNEGDAAEIEQVDYESECDAETLCILQAEGTENKRIIESGSIPGSGVAADKIEQFSVGDQLTISKMRTLETIEGSKIKNPSIDCEDGPTGKDFTSRVVAPRALKRELLSTDTSDAIQRNRSDDFDDLCPRSVRAVGLNKYIGRDRYASDMRCRIPGGGHIVNNRHSLTYHGPYGSGRPRPRNVMESRGFVMTSDRTISEAADYEGLENRVRRQYLSSSSNNVYRPLNRRYLAYRDDIYGAHAGTGLVREDVNPDRSRFRKYPQGFGRDTRGDYRKAMPNYSSEYTDHLPHRLSRRERSISPPSGERLHYAQSYKKSRSRSRSRSPGAWLSMRERNEGSRRRSRSPNFRAGRMDRLRMPFQKRFAAAEYDDRFVSPPRNRFSPQRISRFDDRISGLDSFRDRKSPVRMCRQSHRFDSVNSVRAMVHPRRLADMAGGSRVYKYEGGDDDRRKQGSRYEMTPRVRRYDTDAVMRRLRYNNNAEDSFVANDS